MIRSAITYDHLDELLRGDGRGGYVGLSAIDGLIAAVVAGPVQIEPATWLPPIFGDKMPTPEAGTINERIVNTVLNRHDEVKRQLDEAPADYRPIFMYDDKGKMHAEDWAIGFAIGVTLGQDAWMPILLQAPRPIIAPIMVLTPVLAKLLVRVPVDERRKLKATAWQQIGTVVAQLYAVTQAERAKTPQVKLS